MYAFDGKRAKIARLWLGIVSAGCSSAVLGYGIVLSHGAAVKQAR